MTIVPTVNRVDFERIQRLALDELTLERVPPTRTSRVSGPPRGLLCCFADAPTTQRANDILRELSAALRGAFTARMNIVHPSDTSGGGGGARRADCQLSFGRQAPTDRKPIKIILPNTNSKYLWYHSDRPAQAGAAAGGAAAAPPSKRGAAAGGAAAALPSKRGAAAIPPPESRAAAARPSKRGPAAAAAFEYGAAAAAAAAAAPAEPVPPPPPAPAEPAGSSQLARMGGHRRHRPSSSITVHRPSSRGHPSSDHRPSDHRPSDHRPSDRHHPSDRHRTSDRHRSPERGEWLQHAFG